MGKPKQQRWTTGVAQAVAATLSGGAALVSILSYTSSAGIAVPGVPTPASRAHSVTVAPALDTATAVGDTIQLAAMITDSGGTVLGGVAPTWSSDDPSVAEVSAAGTVAIRGAGSTAIVVRVGSIETRAGIVVVQRPAALQVDDTLLRVPEGDRRPLLARVLDSRGNPIIGADVSWSAPDPGVAKVESADAVGVSPGRTSLLAMAGQLQALLPVEVTPVAGSITVLGGEGQRGAAGAELPVPITAQIVSRSGRPIAGAVAGFQPAGTGASVEPALDTSDARGMVKTLWRLGEIPGRQQLSIAVEGVSTSPTVSAEADPVPANARVEVTTSDLAGEVGDTLREPVVVRVTDSLGRALADLPVAWSSADDGVFTAHAMRTDSLGEARATWKLGTKAGRQRARVQVGNARTMPPVALVAAVEPGSPAGVGAVSGDRQTGTVWQPLPQPIVVRATDRYGNPVGAAALRLLSSGRPADTMLTTDSSGRAKVVWTLGRAAGLQRLTVRLQADTGETELTAVARPGKPVKLAFVSPPETARSGRALPKPLVVQVTDSHGNPVPGRTIVFKAGSGTVAPARGLTDADGRTSVRWTLGPKAKQPELAAKVAGTVISRTLTLTARP
ncbi:MAG TPA: Ig-like domain-containing protein [Gemmatimonadales bacterium]|nr:Ig-like domain-containing protein [Gemmatimonadales bacterium]